MAEKFSLKDHLFNRGKVEKLAGELKGAHAAFRTEAFANDVCGKFPELELKARITWIVQCLKEHLPNDYRNAVGIMLRALPPPNDPNLTDDDFGDFIYAPYAEFVARHGCTKADLAFSLQALHALTQRFSVEDAIRFFINAFPQDTLKTLRVWSTDSHYHVRRLASEGTRPKLPWSQKLTIGFAEPVEILDTLFADKTRYVTRSVANHMNDISKLDATLALSMLQRWKTSGAQNEKEMDFIIRHALRSLIKEGDARALKLIGMSAGAPVKLVALRLPKQVKMNDMLEFSVTLLAEKSARLVVDYAIQFRNKAGELSGRKVFKLKQVELAKQEKTTLEKRHRLRENMTTRKLYHGQHVLEVQVNGKLFGKKLFEIV
jgi:3-methyladenine DNA glycosylase AlkC